MPSSDDIRITLRIKPEEHALLLEKAGNRPISTFIRESALEKVSLKRKSRQAKPIADHRAIAQVLALLGNSDILAEFRRVSKDVEDGTRESSTHTDQLLIETRDRIARIHILLMRALGVSEE